MALFKFLIILLNSTYTNRYFIEEWVKTTDTIHTDIEQTCHYFMYIAKEEEELLTSSVYRKFHLILCSEYGVA